MRANAVPTANLLVSARSCGKYCKKAGFTQSSPPRDFLELFWVAEGKLELNGEKVLGAGEAAFIFPGEAHDYRVTGRETRWRFLTFDGDLDAFLSNYKLQHSVFVAGNCPEHLFDRLQQQIKLHGTASEYAASAQALTILHLALAGIQPENEPEYIRRFKMLVQQHIADRDISVERLADMLNIHRGTLYRKFRTHCKIPPQEYLASARISKAMDLLCNSSLPVTEIASQCGFRNNNYFSKSFFRLTGRLPSELRKAKS